MSCAWCALHAWQCVLHACYIGRRDKYVDVMRERRIAQMKAQISKKVGCSQW